MHVKLSILTSLITQSVVDKYNHSTRINEAASLATESELSALANTIPILLNGLDVGLLKILTSTPGMAIAFSMPEYRGDSLYRSANITALAPPKHCMCGMGRANIALACKSNSFKS